MEEEYEQLSAAEAKDALCRDDDLGRLVAGVFSFSVKPFSDLIGSAYAPQGGKEVG